MPRAANRRRRRLMAWGAVFAGLAAGIWAARRPRRVARGRHTHAPGAAAVALGYEPHDIDAGIVARILLVLAVGAAACVAAVVLMIALLENGDQARYAHFTQEQMLTLEPPPPHLQVRPLVDRDSHEALEQYRLHSDAWLDADHTHARIPIDQAMKLEIGQPLDARP